MTNTNETNGTRRSEELALVRKLGKLKWENACRDCGGEIHSGPTLCKQCAFAREFPQLNALVEKKSEPDRQAENLIRKLAEGSR